MSERTHAEKLGLAVLACGGISSIWTLHVAGAEAFQAGCPGAATAISEVAEAAEAAWLRAEGAWSLLCCSKFS
jgi:hypothetical protein